MLHRANGTLMQNLHNAFEGLSTRIPWLVVALQAA